MVPLLHAELFFPGGRAFPAEIRIEGRAWRKWTTDRLASGTFILLFKTVQPSGFRGAPALIT
jgi:hypothetical protein